MRAFKILNKGKFFIIGVPLSADLILKFLYKSCCGMITNRKLIVYGPIETLRRMAPGVTKEMSPKYNYHYVSLAEKDEVHVYVFEEYQRQLNSSTSLTVVFELSNKSMKVDLLPTGGRMGFRGSASDSDRPAFEAMMDYVTDFGARYGLTLQDITPPPPTEPI